MKVREIRKSKKISQKELSEGICTQATISNIESKNRCDSLVIFSAICRRLDVSVEDCIEYTEEQKLDIFLDKIEDMCSRFEHKDAYQLMNSLRIDDMDVIAGNPELLSKYNYYQGITALVGAEDSQTALFYFHQNIGYKKNPGIYGILSINALGSLYEVEKEIERAKVYYKKSLNLLKHYVGETVSIIYKIYYNSARFYSEIEDYQTSIDLCAQAIYLNEENGTFYHLEALYYELGFNKYMIGEPAMLEYKTAYYLAKHLKNNELAKVIIKDAKRYDLPFQVDENGVI